MDRGDLEREQNIEQLRRIALAQQAQIEQLLEIISRKSRVIDKLRGSSGDMQLTLKLLAELQAKAKATQEALAKVNSDPMLKPERKPRSSTGPTPQPQLPVIEQVFTLDDPDRSCPSCGAELKPMKDQFEESEMIDVIEVDFIAREK